MSNVCLDADATDLGTYPIDICLSLLSLQVYSYLLYHQHAFLYLYILALQCLPPVLLHSSYVVVTLMRLPPPPRF